MSRSFELFRYKSILFGINFSSAMFHVINEIIIRLDVVESYQDYVAVYTENTKLHNEYPSKFSMRFCETDVVVNSSKC